MTAFGQIARVRHSISCPLAAESLDNDDHVLAWPNHLPNRLRPGRVPIWRGRAPDIQPVCRAERRCPSDRKSVAEGKRASVRVDLVGLWIIKHKNIKHRYCVT